MKPIEPGCLVIMVGADRRSDQVGMSFTVDRENETAIRFFGGRGWWLDDGEWAFERHLLRIDDYQPEATETEQEVTV